MANQLQVSKLRGYALIGPNAAVRVSKLRAYVLISATAAAPTVSKTRVRVFLQSATGAVAVPIPAVPAALTPPVLPAISGTAQVGAVATVVPGVYTESPTSLAYQWKRAGSNIAGQTGTTYTRVLADVAVNLTVVETPSNAVGAGSPATSAPSVTLAPSVSEIDVTALFAALNAGVGTSGGKVFLLAHAAFGACYFQNYDFSSNPIIIKGQTGTVFDSFVLDNCKGITAQDFNVTGEYATAAGVQVLNGSAHINLTNVNSYHTAALGTKQGNGFWVQDSTFVHVNGGEVYNRGNGVGVSMSDDVTVENLTIHHVGPDAILVGGTLRPVIRHNFGHSITFDPGAHPHFIRLFGANGVNCDSAVVTNNLYLRQNGQASQAIVLENASSALIQGNAGYGGLLDFISISAGTGNTVNDNFGIGLNVSVDDNQGSRIIVRDASINATVTSNYAGAISNYAGGGTNTGFVPDPLPGSNTIIGVALPGDYSALDAWLVNHPATRQRPDAPPVNTVAPAISGAGIVGTTAAVSTGTWANSPTGYAYQWKRNGSAISGAAAASYVYVDADADQTITVAVRAANDFGATSATSSAVTPLQPAAPGNLVAPAITGSTVQGSTGTLSLGSWSHSPTAYAAQWYRGATPIGGATGFTYTYVLADVGQNITGKITATNDRGPTPATSNIVVPTGAPSGIPVHNADELYTALNTATGGEVFLCDASTDFLDVLFPAAKDFTSSPVTVQCQTGTVFNSIFIGNFKGATINGGNIYGSYAGVNAGLMIQNGSAHITTNGLTSNTGDSDGTQHGNGIQIRDSSFVTINGQNDSTKIDVSGRGQGVALIDSSDINLSGLTFKNIEVDEIDLANIATANINACLGWDKWPQVGDHPDFIQAWGVNSNITIQNSGWEQKGGGGEFGGAGQGITLEGTHTNTVISTCWVLGGLNNSFQISGGSNATVQRCFAQGFLTYGSRFIARDGTVDCTVTDCTAASVQNFGSNPGFSETGTTHISDVAAGTHADLDAWLALHPGARARP